MWTDVERFFDWWNLLGVILLLILFGTLLTGSIWIPQTSIGPEAGILILTGVYAFTAFNQMRESRWTRRQGEGMALRPHFTTTPDGTELVLQNFGEGSALDLRLRAVLKSQDGKQQYDLVSEDDTVHLQQGEYCLVFRDELASLNDIDSKLYSAPDAKLEFYYTWEATNGRQYPSDIDQPTSKPMDTIVDITDTPRTVKLSEVHERLS